MGFVLAAAAATTITAASLVPPVDAPVARRFDAPATAYASGHRGIDYMVAEGTAVRAAGPGEVVFAGRTPTGAAVTIAHDGGLRTTYSSLADIYVAPGQDVAAGTWLGRSSEAHPGKGAGLHFGVLLGGDYVDPQLYLAPTDIDRAIHLAPLARDLPEHFAAGEDCRAATGGDRSAPNDNVVVLVAGITTRTHPSTDATIYRTTARDLGYAPGDVYPFSYAGTDGDRHHEPYGRTDTYGDIRAAARGLRALVQLIAKEHPERDIDLIAHSQGGIVARAFLQEAASQPGLPRIEHLVTLASPHRGAPLAGTVEGLDETLVGSLALDGANLAARNGVPIPDPRSPAVTQLAPGSDLMRSMARQDIVYGTSALSIAMPHDIVVPADRTVLAGETNRVVAPEGLFGHSAIVTSQAALDLAHAFLRDAPGPCTGMWDTWGRWSGRAISIVEGLADDLVAAAESLVGGPLVALARLAGL